MCVVVVLFVFMIEVAFSGSVLDMFPLVFVQQMCFSGFSSEPWSLILKLMVLGISWQTLTLRETAVDAKP